MKVLHVICTLSSGGAEKMLVDIVKEMRKQNINCEVAVLNKSNNFFGEEIEKLDIPIYYGPNSKVYSLKNIVFIKSIIQKTNYDCIHTHLFAAQLFTPIALKMARINIPLITTEHSTHNKRREIKLFYFLDYMIYQKYNKIIAITNDAKKNLVTYLPKTEKKIEVIENGIDIKEYLRAYPLNKKDISNDIEDFERIVLMVAAMRHQKDHETLIRASKILPKNYRVVFVGSGDRIDEVKNYAKKNGRDTILFLGQRKDVPAIMKTSDIFVLSSKWEGFGLVVVEAAAAGLPIVASDVEGLNEVVRDIGGQLFEPYNEIDLANKIMNCSKKSRNDEIVLAKSKYTIQNTVAKYIEVYKNLFN